MREKKQKKIVKEGQYLAEVEVTLIDKEDSWSPYLTPADALKLDEVRLLLKKGDIQSAQKYGKVYLLKPVAA